MDTAYKAADTALDGRLDAIDGGSALDTTNGTLAARVAALETEVDMTSTDSRIDTALSRIEAMDNSSTGSIAGLDTRIDALETTVNTSTTGLSDRMTVAEHAIRHTATGGDPGGLTERITAVETNISGQDGIIDRLDAIDNTSTGAIVGLDARLDAIDGGTVLTGNTLAARVTTLEGKDTIIVDYDGEHSNYTNDEPNLSSPSENADYLIADDEGKYFYWRYINNNWELISGAGGGSGSSSGLILAELPAVSAGDPNIDYFIGTNATGYTHYRFVAAAAGESEGHYIRILPNNLISDLSVDQYGGLVAHNLGDNQTNLLADFYALNGVTYTPNYDPNDPTTLVSQTLQFTGTDGQNLDPIVIVGGGGGGGSVYTVRIETTTDIARSIPASNTDPVTIRAKVVMKQGSDLVPGATATGQIQYRVYGTTTWNNGDQIEVEAIDPSLKYTIQNDTYFTVDVSKYLQVDKTIQIRLVISAYPEDEETAVMRYQTYSVSKVNISIADESFDYASVKSSSFRYNYRCFGSGITKTVHFVMDGSDIATANVGTSHDTVLQQDIPMTGKANGMHTFQVYFVTNTGLESNRLNYFILYNTDATRQAPLLGAAAESTSITDGDELIVNYSVSTPGSETTDSVEIELYTMDNNVKNTISTVTLTNVTNNVLADPPYRTFDYPKVVKTDPNTDPDPITVYVKLTASHTMDIEGTPTVLTDSRTVSITVNYLNTTYILEPEGTNNLLYSYSAYGRSNNDAVKDTYTYTYTTVGGQDINFTGTFNDFNWATDGYKDGESLIIAGGATYDIDVPIFNTTFNGVNIEENGEQEITQNGRTIEIDYEVLSATNLNATIIDCMSTGVNPIGFRVTPQSCYLLNSGSSIDIDETGFIKNEENVAAAYLNPGTRTHLTFVIEPWAADLASDGNYHQSTNIYINGEFANACPYRRNSTTGNLDGNNFSTNATITIGSDTCLIKLYSIKLYNRGLTESQVLHNYEVAPVATRNKITRMEDNDVLNEQGYVDYEKARKKYTCLLLTGMGTVNGVAVPTMAPYKGYPSVVGRKKGTEVVGKTESGLLLTKPTTENSNGYTVEFDLQDKMIDPDNQFGYASSNNVQGTSSQKFPIKNLKVYLAKGDDTGEIAFDTSSTVSVKKVYKYSVNTAAAAAYMSVYPSAASLPDYITECGENINTIVKNLDAVPSQAEVVALIEDYLTNEDSDVGAAYSTYSTGDELIIHPIKAYKNSKKVKYALRENGLGESTLCWKADYMSTDHANTFNANIANTLYSTEDRLSNRWTDQTQYAVYGIKCLLFQKNGDGQPEFVGDGCLNNDKGNHKTFGLETNGDRGIDTMCQKWDFRNNTNSLLFFKHDGLFQEVDSKPAASSCLECIYPDEGDLAEEGITPNYNHFQILSSWLGNRANYWYETNSTTRATKKQIFIDEFTNHFNLNHILIYYLFMEYTALCDNRVKNIHMRTDNAGEERIKIAGSNEYYFEGNSNPNSGPWTIASNLETRTMQEPLMDENGNYQFDQSGNMVLGNVNHVFVKDSILNTIDWQQGEGHSNFAIWAPTLYDLDSCFGAENVGYLKVRYDADWNYSLYNKLQFAGFDSILWLQVEDCFQDELKAMAKTLYNRAVGLNYSTFYRRQITDNLASLCPAITNQDMILKYDKPWTEGYLDYTKDPPAPNTDEYKYLQRGTRTSQKATFMKQRSMFLASRYDGNEFKQDKITFRAGTLVNHDNAILTLTANQKLYHGVQFGDLNDVSKVTRRANKIYNATNDTWDDIGPDEWIPEFVPCRVQNIGDMGNTDGLEIYGASVLNDIGDISKFHPYQIDVSGAVNLKKLIIGSSTSGFSNTSTTGIGGINACALLEEVNVCNCKNLTSLQLSNNGFIKKVYATGSGLNTLSLPQGGILDTIAYGENTTDITIINQGRLTNFSYEDSENNNYANVTRLWIENTPNVPVKDIVTARLTARSSADQGLRAGGLRLVGINLDLGSDTSFLQLLASNLIEGTYLSSAGSHIEGTTQTPYISGTIKISKIRSSLYDKLHARYPDLVINYTEKTQEFEVTYKNYDGTLLYTDYGTNEDPLKDPVADEDPITHAPYLEMPTKPQDAQYQYRFGTYDNQGRYRKFSGWVRQGTTTNPVSGQTINGSIILVAYYPTTITQRYTVTWYNEADGSPVGIPLEEDYGTDLSSRATPVETGDLARVRQTGNAVKVFKGWSRPLGKLTENVNVYGQWETSFINDATASIAMENLTAADLYAITQIQDSEVKRTLLKDHIGEPIYVQMGHDFEYTEGVSVTNLLGSSDKIVLDSSTDEIKTFNSIKPLSINSDWTLAIDYRFLLNNIGKVQFNNASAEYVLLSCYENANSAINGFKLSLVKDTSGNNRHMVQVSWGTESVTVDYIYTDTTLNDKMWFYSYRNVVVLSHNSDNPKVLRVSYVAPNLTNANANATTNYGSNYGTYVTNTPLTYDSNTTINTPLIIGGNYSGSSTTIENSTFRKPAEGIVYWAKFWNTDLGVNNCSKLASWIHETVPFYFSGYNGTGDGGGTEQIYENTALSFVAAQGMGDRYAYALKNNPTDTYTSNGYYGYSLTGMASICDNLIYAGLPESYQSIVRSTLISTRIRHSETGNYSTEETNNYMFLPSIREVDIENVTASQYGSEVNPFWTPPWHWMVAANRTNLYGFVSGQYNQVEQKSGTVITYLYRFLGRSIEDTARIFNTGLSDPAGISGLQLKTGNTFVSISVRSGDVWINENNEAYIYFSNAEIAEGARIDIPTTTGGWRKAMIWNVRSIGSGNSRSSENALMRVGANGEITFGPAAAQLAEQGRLMCPEFTI